MSNLKLDKPSLVYDKKPMTSSSAIKYEAFSAGHPAIV